MTGLRSTIRRPFGRQIRILRSCRKHRNQSASSAPRAHQRLLVPRDRARFPKRIVRIDGGGVFCKEDKSAARQRRCEVVSEYRQIGIVDPAEHRGDPDQVEREPLRSKKISWAARGEAGVRVVATRSRHLDEFGTEIVPNGFFRSGELPKGDGKTTGTATVIQDSLRRTRELGAQKREELRFLERRDAVEIVFRNGQIVDAPAAERACAFRPPCRELGRRGRLVAVVAGVETLEQSGEDAGRIHGVLGCFDTGEPASADVISRSSDQSARRATAYTFLPNGTRTARSMTRLTGKI
jgi:hypothetical protein